eukprot:CAMPEP_0171961612 /NCGR_PEP_ID=MMETSP0993-20121228/163806_1 /TAXON_ID=483369 /ORGANISM="non described non described, Strain CCMP2098" /LENGTH=70 /DNA_ID=CAMNT_0012609713 /DNA_START=1 /DNA_END=209 /DNA_ORIENTATION=+
MRAHLFYLGIIISLVLISHKAMFVFFEYKGLDVPSVLGAPGVEVQLFLALFMGIIDVSAQVLVNGETAPG